MTITMSRLPLGTGVSLISGLAGLIGTAGAVATVVSGRVALGAASAALSNRSTTSRLPYCWLGARTKLLGVTAFFRSMTTRRSVGVRWAERRLVMGVFAVDTLSGAARVAPLISITRRSGDVSVKTLCSTGPDRSNTSRVLSGARHKRTLRTWEAASALTATVISIDRKSVV